MSRFCFPKGIRIDPTPALFAFEKSDFKNEMRPSSWKNPSIRNG